MFVVTVTVQNQSREPNDGKPLFDSHSFIRLKMDIISSCFARLFSTCLRIGFSASLLGYTLNVFNVVTGSPYLKKEDDA